MDFIIASEWPRYSGAHAGKKNGDAAEEVSKTA